MDRFAEEMSAAFAARRPARERTGRLAAWAGAVVFAVALWLRGRNRF